MYCNCILKEGNLLKKTEIEKKGRSCPNILISFANIKKNKSICQTSFSVFLKDVYVKACALISVLIYDFKNSGVATGRVFA